MYILALQWNPHYQCFTDTTAETCCTKIVKSYLNQVPFDFANIVALETCYKNLDLDEKYSILNSYYTSDCDKSSSAQTCHYDITSIIYDTSKWKTDGKMYYTCLDPSAPDRSALAYRFTSRTDPNFKLVVIGAHFSHDPDQSLENLRTWLNQKFSVNENMLLLADTNIDSPDRNNMIISSLQSASVMAPKWTVSKPVTSCCYQDSGKTRNHMYDIVATNFSNNPPSILSQYSNFFSKLAATIISPNPTCTDSKTPHSLEMHDPIVAEILVNSGNSVTENYDRPPSSKNCDVWMITSLVLLILLIILLIVLGCMLYKKVQK